MDSPLSYIGGKSRLSHTIIERLPEHITYIEVFGGACWVFFRKPPSKFEIINDLDSELICFWRVIQNHKAEFMRQCDWQFCSREAFNLFNAMSPRHMTDIQRAVRYFYIQRLCYGGRVRSRTFGISAKRGPRINWAKLDDALQETHRRLRQATIENLTWQDCLSRYDRPDSMFFLDPPYYKAPYYQHNLGLDDYKEMATALGDIKGKFLLTINKEPDMQSVFSAFRTEEVSLQYSVAAKRRIEAKELLISNY